MNIALPQYYGGSSARVRARYRLLVHPRACGKCIAQQVGYGMYGSSPRVRGTLGDLAHHPLFVRFIPARAGNALH